MRIEIFGLALIAVLILTGCTPAMRDDINYAVFKEQQRWNGVDRGQQFRDWFDLDAMFNTYEGQEAQAEREICRHPNQNRRTTLQSDVSDQFDYTECAAQPLPREAPGQRLVGRPAV